MLMIRGDYQRRSGRVLPRIVGGLVVTGVLLAASAAQAAFILGSTDAGSEYPSVAEAMFRTADAVTAAAANIDTRGVRFNRVQSQSFQVTQKFAVESIYIGYQWNNITNPQNWPINFRLLEIDNIGLLYAPPNAPPTPITPTLQTAVVAPVGTATSAFMTLRLDWQGPRLLLGPRDGAEGYAIEFIGSGNNGASTPIGIVARNDNPKANSRALEYDNQTNLPIGANQNYDFIVAITGRLAPEPSSLLLVAVGLLGASVVRKRRT
jgi:hypothetical protein